MPLSPQVHKDDASGDQQPGHAILAFVSLAEKHRFLQQFEGFPIRDYIAITMYGRRLICNRVRSSNDGRYNSWRKRLNCSKEHHDEGHVAGSGEWPVGPGSSFYVAPEMQHDTTTPNGKPDLPDPFSMKNGVADPGAVSDDPRGNLCGTTSPSIPTARAPTWCNLPLNGSPPLSNGITADSIMRPRGGPGIFGLG